MRHTLLLSAAVLATACQAPPPEVTTLPRAETTFTRGTERVTRAETTHVMRESPSPMNPGMPASSEVMVTLDRETYARGADVMLRLMSHSSETLGFNPCSSRTVERQQGSSWVAHPEPDRMCTMELRMLMPHQTQTVRTDLPGDLTPGTYRIAVVFSRQATAPPNAPANWGTVRAVSPNFRVQ